jgi:hypothetical protein
MMEAGAYERLVGEALEGDPLLFARQDAVEIAWEVVSPILGTDSPIHEYQPGTLGALGGPPPDGRGGRLALPREDGLAVLPGARRMKGADSVADTYLCMSNYPKPGGTS